VADFYGDSLIHFYPQKHSWLISPINVPGDYRSIRAVNAKYPGVEAIVSLQRRNAIDLN
jgi:hypothetical protein